LLDCLLQAMQVYLKLQVEHFEGIAHVGARTNTTASRTKNVARLLEIDGSVACELEPIAAASWTQGVLILRRRACWKVMNQLNNMETSVTSLRRSSSFEGIVPSF
jgi:hypothetical protein